MIYSILWKKQTNKQTNTLPTKNNFLRKVVFHKWRWYKDFADIKSNHEYPVEGNNSWGNSPTLGLSYKIAEGNSSNLMKDADFYMKEVEICNRLVNVSAEPNSAHSNAEIW